MPGTELSIRLIGFVALLAVLVLGRALLIPLVFTLLLWVLVNAIADWLQRLRLPRWLAWFGSLALLVAAMYFAALIVAGEAGQFAAEAPGYASKLDQILARFLAPLHLGINVSDVFSRADFAAMLTAIAASLGTSAFAILQIIVYLGFLLAEQNLLSAKLEKLQTDGARRDEGRVVLQTISRQLQSFLAVSTVLSAVMAGATFGLLALLGVPFAAFTALLMFFVSYIPTVGAAAVVLPMLVALVQFGTIAQPLIILFVLGALHFALMNILAPMLLGQSLNLSPFVIIIALSFWGLVWGIAGLFLAVPLTAAIAIACTHVPRLRWVSILLAAPQTKR